MAAACALALLLGGCRGGSQFPLDRTPASPRLLFSPIASLTSATGPGSLPVAAADLDGDGTNELVAAWQDAIQVVDQEGEDLGISNAEPLPYSLRPGNQRILIGVAGDVLGDPRAELLVTACLAPQDGLETLEAWEFRVLADLEPVRRHPLPQGPDLDGDGTWDGHYFVMGYIPASAGAGVPLAILGCEVGYDVEGRGILAIEADSGKVAWSFATGGNPHRAYGHFVGDLDGDGVVEIVFTTTAPGNLKDRTRNGYADTTAYLIVLDERGRRIWDKEIGPEMSRTYLRVADVDQDGKQEIITASHAGRPGWRHLLCVWRGLPDPAPAQRELRSSCEGMGVLPAFGTHPAEIVVGDDMGLVTKFQWRESKLDSVAATRSSRGLQVIAARPWPGLPEGGILLQEQRRLLMLDRRLRLVAAQSVPKAEESRIWVPDPDHAYVALAAEPPAGVAFRLVPVNRARSSPAIWAVGVALLMVAAPVFHRWRRRSAHAVRTAQPGPPPRHLLERMLDDLSQTRHGGDTQRMKRLVQTAVLLAETSTGQETLAAGLATSFRSFAEADYPVLLECMDTAQAIGFEPAPAARAAAALRRFRELLAQLVAEGGSPGAARAVRVELEEQRRVFCDCLLHIRKRLLARFTVDLGATIAQEVDFLAERLDRLGIVCTIEDRAGAQALCQIDSMDLRHVINNLLENAVRAMQDSPVRKLTVAYEIQEGQVVCQVRDTGGGIPAERQDDLFTSGGSARRNRRRGLPRDWELVRKWDGSLRLVSSEPGGGSIFELRLIKAEPAEALRPAAV